MQWLLFTLLAAEQIRWMPEGPRPDAIALTPSGLEISGRGSYPNWMRSQREYENLRLRFDYQLAQWSEAAVILRAPKWGRPMRAGLAITLAHDFHRKRGLYVTGAISGVKPPLKLLPESWGRWHSVEISLDRQELTVKIDGEIIQHEPRLDRPLGPGHIIFPDLGHRYSIRNVEIDALDASTPLQHPFERAGAQRGASGQWTVNGPAITGADGHSIYYSRDAFADFTLQAYVRTHDRVNAGIFLRGSARERDPRGFEVQIYSPPDAVYPTGSIYNHVRSDVEVDYEERWFFLEVTVVGRTCQVRIDGRIVAQTAALPPDTPARGAIGLQIHSDRGRVDFEAVRVMIR